MILVSFVLMYLAIVKKFEPLLLLPIAFGMFLANFPLGGVNDLPNETMRFLGTLPEASKNIGSDPTFAAMLQSGEHLVQHVSESGIAEVFAMKSNYVSFLIKWKQAFKVAVWEQTIYL